MASSKKTSAPPPGSVRLTDHNRLQRVVTLPTVWIPDGAIRDRRALFRTRMVFTHRRTSIKNRIHATLSKYGIRIEDTSDIFNNKGRAAIATAIEALPEHTQFAVTALLSDLDNVEAAIGRFEQQMVTAVLRNRRNQVAADDSGSRSDSG